MSSHPLRPALLGAVAAGGAVGACLRWGIETRYAADAGEFPWPTFGINVLGTVLLALLPAAGFVRRHPLLPPALGTGVLGGFTTLSAYSEQTRVLLADGRWVTAATYVLGTLVACLVGVALAQRLSRPADRAEFEAEEGDL